MARVGIDVDGELVSEEHPLPVAMVGGDPENPGVVTVPVPTAMRHGQATVVTAGTEVPLGSSQALVSGVTVKAKPTNTGTIYVGGNPVTSTTGYPLAAGDAVFVEIDNINKVYVDASVSGEGVGWIGS